MNFKRTSDFIKIPIWQLKLIDFKGQLNIFCSKCAFEVEIIILSSTARNFIKFGLLFFCLWNWITQSILIQFWIYFLKTELLTMAILNMTSVLLNAFTLEHIFHQRFCTTKLLWCFTNVTSLLPRHIGRYISLGNVRLLQKFVVILNRFWKLYLTLCLRMTNIQIRLTGQPASLS